MKRGPEKGHLKKVTWKGSPVTWKWPPVTWKWLRVTRKWHLVTRKGRLVTWKGQRGTWKGSWVHLERVPGHLERVPCHLESVPCHLESAPSHRKKNKDRNHILDKNFHSLRSQHLISLMSLFRLLWNRQLFDPSEWKNCYTSKKKVIKKSPSEIKKPPQWLK